MTKLMDNNKQETKPDFDKVATAHLKDTEHRDYFKIGCEHVWSEHVVPIQKKNEQLRNSIFKGLMNRIELRRKINILRSDKEELQKEVSCMASQIESMSADYKPSFLDQLEKEKANKEELLQALKWFCERVEKGEVRSKNTYAKFKELISKHEAK